MTGPSGSNETPLINEGPSQRRILYPIFQSESETVLRLAADLADAFGAELIAGYVDTEDHPYSYETSRDTAQVVFKAKTDPSVDVPVHGHTLTGSDPLDAVVAAVTTYNINAIVMGDETAEHLEAQIARHTDRDTVIVNDQNRLESVASILVPIAGGPYSDAAVDVAGALATANDALVELVHVVEGDDASETKEGAEDILEAGRSRLSDIENVDTRVIDADDAVDQILEESQYHDITVIGAPQKNRLRRLIFGSTTDEVREQAQNTVMMVRHGSDPETSLFSDSLP